MKHQPFANSMKELGATVTWAPNSITFTPDTVVAPKIKGIAVDCGQITDAAMNPIAVVAHLPEFPQ
jgi:3-phosphoshikimate 1-carboxyvinyltransferase